MDANCSDGISMDGDAAHFFNGPHYSTASGVLPIRFTQHHQSFAIELELKPLKPWDCCPFKEYLPVLDQKKRCVGAYLRRAPKAARARGEQWPFSFATGCIVLHAFGLTLSVAFNGRLVLHGPLREDEVRPSTILRSAGTVVDGRWHHVHLSGDLTNNVFSLSVNGASSSGPLAHVSAPAPWTVLRWGHVKGIPNKPFAGRIRRLRVHGDAKITTTARLRYDTLPEHSRSPNKTHWALEQLVTQSGNGGVRALVDGFRRLSERNSSCVPQRTVVATLVNRFHEPLLQQQVTHLPACFVRRYGALCSGDVAHSTRLGRLSCFPVADAKDSELLSGDFVLLTWVRWEVMDLLLAEPALEAVLWLDSDVLVLQNPFAAAAALHDGGAPYDLVHQVEFSLDHTNQGTVRELERQRQLYERPAAIGDVAFLGPHTSNANTGVLLLRSRELARAILSARLTGEWEQVVCNRVLNDQAWRRLALPDYVATSRCWFKVEAAADAHSCGASQGLTQKWSRSWSGRANTSAVAAATESNRSFLCGAATFHSNCRSTVPTKGGRGQRGETGKLLVLQAAAAVHKRCCSPAKWRLPPGQ